MPIHTLPLGQLEANCYIVAAPGSKSCAVIDPGGESSVLLQKLEALGLRVDAILLTHGHFDHVGAVEALVKATGCALWMCQSDYTQFPNPTNDFLYPIHDCDFTEVHFCEEGEQICAGGVTFTALHTPGHSWGSMCYRWGDALFTGDTLFAGSIGRVDFPGSSPKAMRESLARLAQLEDGIAIYPGHGGSSTIGAEKATNPYLR